MVLTTFGSFIFKLKQKTFTLKFCIIYHFTILNFFNLRLKCLLKKMLNVKKKTEKEI